MSAMPARGRTVPAWLRVPVSNSGSFGLNDNGVKADTEKSEMSAAPRKQDWVAQSIEVLVLGLLALGMEMSRVTEYGVVKSPEPSDWSSSKVWRSHPSGPVAPGSHSTMAMPASAEKPVPVTVMV